LAAIAELFSAQPERIRLNAEAEQLLGPWYAQYAHNEDCIAIVNRFVEEVLEAWKEWKRSGTEPDTSQWHDNQCTLWCIVSKI
jgi:hypothetical protein